MLPINFSRAFARFADPVGALAQNLLRCDGATEIRSGSALMLEFHHR